MSLSIQQALAISDSSEGFIVYSKTPVEEMNEKLDKIITYIDESIEDIKGSEDINVETATLIELHLREISNYVKSLKE